MHTLILFLLTALIGTGCLPGIDSNAADSASRVFARGDAEIPLASTISFSHEKDRPTFIDTHGRTQQSINEKEDILFYVSRRENTSQVFVDDLDSLRSSGFDPKVKTVIVTSGFLSSDSHDTVQQIRDAYLHSMDCNVVVVDWSILSLNHLYPEAKRNTVPVGHYMAKFIDFVAREMGVDVGDLKLVGHSLGAHVMGIAGKNVQSGKLGRITGPSYSLSDPSDRLAVGDATFVQVIHSCAGVYGIKGAIADADFFPNGGSSEQPGCGTFIGGAMCSHSRSWMYFTESITSSKFLAVPCDSYENFLNGSCSDRDKVAMGEPTPNSIRGTYYLNTASSSPFALG
ncbi:phospholipase A1-like isoform X2 [Ischnura elegans]|uniref:phospholipase A1-like isoform X2 n=1 Tax=Ischnura elegans TaxID=197161 RepID=UPI001ED87CDE|nr:phospholipase A1-like isoform X2 [Ischnura elegans]